VVPPCRATIPHLIELHEKYAPKGVVIMSLTDGPKAKVKPFAERMGMVCAIGCGSPTGRAYGVRGIPHAFVVDVEGRVVWQGHPAEKGFEQAIEGVRVASCHLRRHRGRGRTAGQRAKAMRSDKAEAYLEKVIKAYPDTRCAAEAKEMFEALRP